MCCITVAYWLAADVVSNKRNIRHMLSCDTSHSIVFGHHHHHHHHYGHHGRVADEVRRVVAPPCPWSTARLQSSPVGRVESFRSWSSQLFRGRPGGRRHVRSGGRLSDTLMWS